MLVCWGHRLHFLPIDLLPWFFKPFLPQAPITGSLPTTFSHLSPKPQNPIHKLKMGMSIAPGNQYQGTAHRWREIGLKCLRTCTVLWRSLAACFFLLFINFDPLKDDLTDKPMELLKVSKIIFLPFSAFKANSGKSHQYLPFSTQMWEHICVQYI